MIVTIYTDTFAQSQELFDICSLSNLITYNFIEDVDTYGIDITVHNRMEELFALEKVQRFVCTYFDIEEVEE